MNHSLTCRANSAVADRRTTAVVGLVGTAMAGTRRERRRETDSLLGCWDIGHPTPQSHGLPTQLCYCQWRMLWRVIRRYGYHAIWIENTCRITSWILSAPKFILPQLKSPRSSAEYLISCFTSKATVFLSPTEDEYHPRKHQGRRRRGFCEITRNWLGWQGDFSGWGLFVWKLAMTYPPASQFAFGYLLLSAFFPPYQGRASIKVVTYIDDTMHTS